MENFPIEGVSNYGTIVFLDLDKFHNCIEKKGWSEYTPNPITDFLTVELEKIIRKYRAMELFGVNKHRGTEEAILYFHQNYKKIYEVFENLRRKLERFAEKMNAPTSLSVGITKGKVPKVKRIKSHNVNEFKKDPYVFLAYKALKKAKKKGGNCIFKF